MAKSPSVVIQGFCHKNHINHHLHDDVVPVGTFHDLLVNFTFKSVCTPKSVIIVQYPVAPPFAVLVTPLISYVGLPEYVQCAHAVGIVTIMYPEVSNSMRFGDFVCCAINCSGVVNFVVDVQALTSFDVAL